MFFNKTCKVNLDGKISKPAKLKELHLRQVQFELITGIILSTCAMLCYYKMSLRRKENYMHCSASRSKFLSE